MCSKSKKISVADVEQFEMLVSLLRSSYNEIKEL